MTKKGQQLLSPLPEATSVSSTLIFKGYLDG